jgi:hypothetical protein
MSYEIPGFSFTLPAAVDLSSAEFTFVTVDANGLCNVPAAGGRVIGALNNKPRAGESATIVNSGIAQVVASAAIAVGSDVAATATGQAAVWATGNFKAGVALEAASAAGVIIAVLLASNHG